MRRLAIAIILCLAAAIPLHAAITGTLINSDGQPVAGAKVSIYPLELPEAAIARLTSASAERTPLASTTSDSKGKFSIPSPKEPVATLAVSAPNYAPTALDTERDDELGALLLLSAPMKQGRITANGKPVANAKVILRGGTDFVATTDAEGRYSAPDAARWARRITIIHPDFAVFQEFERGPGNQVKLDQTLSAGTTISGRVVGADGKTPVAGAILTIGGIPVGKSGEDGSFSIAHAPKDWLTIEARSNDLAGSFAHDGNASAVVRVDRIATIRGTLRDMKTLAPLAGARVNTDASRRFTPIAAGAITDAKGAFTLTVPPGNYELRVSRPGYGATSTDVNVAAGASVAKNLVATQLARVSGSVVDENKTAVAGTRIEAGSVARESGMRMGRFRMAEQQYAFAGPDGTFVMRAEPDTDIQIEARKKGYPEARTPTMRLSPGERKAGVTLTIPLGLAVSGRVIDKNGKPVSGAAIYATEARSGGNFVRRIMRTDTAEADNVVKTAADGTFTTRLKAASYSIRVKHEGYATKTLPTMTVAAGMQPVEVTLDPGVSLAGRVTRGGNGVADVTVQLFGEDNDSTEAKTAPDGSFRIDGLTPGQAMMNVEKEAEGVEQFRSVAIPSDNLVIDVPVGGTVSGRVVDKESKNPVREFDAGYTAVRGGGGMMIMGGGSSKHFTNDDGTFTLEHVTPGAMNITVTAPGYTQGRAQNINVEDGKRIADLEVQLEHGAHVTGRVTGPDGSPLSGVSVMAAPAGARRFPGGFSPLASVTDASGEYSLDNVETGDKTFTFDRNGFLTTQKNATISGADARVDAQMSTGLRISGVVVNDAGAPMADAGVSASSASDSAFGGRSTRTDANGQFTMDDLAPGRYTFRAQKSGYAPGSLPDFDISAGAPVRIVVQSGGTITGHITGLSADELSQVGVIAQIGNMMSSGTVDSSGNYRIDGAPVGTLRVYASAGSGMGGRMSTPKSVTIDAGGSAQVDLDFPTGTVSGRVTRDGKPSSQAIVMFMPGRGTTATNVRTSTDGDGKYTAVGLSDATYTVQVIDLGAGTPYQTTYESHGSGTFNIDIKSATVRGRVIDTSTGKPVDDAAITIRAAGDSPMRFGLRTIATDASGTFIADSVPAGNYTVSAEKDGYGVKTADLTVGDSGGDVELQLTPNAGVKLRVVDARDGRAISAFVRAVDATNKVVYESPFRFTSGGSDTTTVPLDAGTYRVTVTASGYATQTVMMTSPSTQTVGLTPGGSIAIKSTGSTMRRARLMAADGREYARSFGFPAAFGIDPSPGTTLLENIAPGTYTLQLLGDGDAVVGSAQVTVVEGQVAQVSI